eukprot:4088142-Ditylum_brightwellii.AAC.1
MRWNYKLSHYFLKWIQSLMRIRRDGQPPMIPTPTNSQANYSDMPGILCALYWYRKGAPTCTGSKHVVETDPGVLCANDSTTGKMVSVDQYVSKVKEQLPHTKGKESASSLYSGGTIFYDHASKLVYISNQ